MPANLRAVNYWPDTACAKAFWSQHQLTPYQELLADTVAWLQPGAQERWLDLGCGGGQLSRALWTKSQGAVAEVVGLDCAAANARAYEKLRARLQPRPSAEQLRFVAADFSHALAGWQDASFDGVVSGLAIQYAESYSQESGAWTSKAYDRILQEVHRLLRPGGGFIFSVNVPEPSWARVAWSSIGGLRFAPNPLKYLLRAWQMYTYGGWLKREARRGRFHYLPWPVIRTKLEHAGFVGLEHRRSYAEQAFLVRARKPGLRQGQAA